MADHENTATTPSPTEEGHGKDHRASQLAAAVEAAYILEALRK